MKKLAQGLTRQHINQLRSSKSRVWSCSHCPTEGCRWRSKWPMHLVSLESLGFRNLNVNGYTTDYCYRPYIPLNLSGHGQLECDWCSRCITYTDRTTSIWVREKAKTLLNKSEDGSGPGPVRMWCCSRCFMMRLWNILFSRSLEVCFLIF